MIYGEKKRHGSKNRAKECLPDGNMMTVFLRMDQKFDHSMRNVVILNPKCRVVEIEMFCKMCPGNAFFPAEM